MRSLEEEVLQEQFIRHKAGLAIPEVHPEP
jgi:hypothetical protein